jgi:hypothetical protein
MSHRAKFIKEITFRDPNTGVMIEMEVYKHENGGMFAIDSSFLEQVVEDEERMETVILDPFSQIEEPESLYLEDRNEEGG